MPMPRLELSITATQTNEYAGSGALFELWMPDLTTKKNLGEPGITPHQAGIMTAVTSIELNESGNYKITGPSGLKGTPAMHSMTGAKVYQANLPATSARNQCIYMSLPMPACVVVLDPVPATISGSAPTTSGTYAVGLRLFYDKANTPKLVYPNGTSATIPFYACPLEGRRPGHPHSEASEDGVRQAELERLLVSWHRRVTVKTDLGRNLLIHCDQQPQYVPDGKYC